jgi:tetratricopeptide (TPR) repeat protein
LQGIPRSDAPRALRGGEMDLPFALCPLPSLVSDRSRQGTSVFRHSRPGLHIANERMSWLSRLFGGRSESELKPQRLDYMSEALALERSGDFDAAITSYRLALRAKPDDTKALQNLAIALTRVNRFEEAIKAYRQALLLKPALSGPHYGLAFLHIKRGERDEAIQHLEAFLAAPPASGEPERWIEHARETLASLRADSFRPQDHTASPPSSEQ